MTHNARVSSRLTTPEADDIPRLWLWLEGAATSSSFQFTTTLIVCVPS